MHSHSKVWPLLASLALGLVAVPAAAEGQGQQQKMTPTPLQQTGGKTLQELLKDAKESDTKLDALPAPARSTIEQWAGGVAVKKVKMYTLKDGRVLYLGQFEKNDKKVEVVVTADGQTIAKGKDVGD